MTQIPEDFPVTDVEDFASFLGLNGTDADMFYESYYKLNINDEWHDLESHSCA